MTILKLPASKLRQGDLTLFSTAIKVKILMQSNFYSVETLDPNRSDSGYQRLLNQSRANQVAEYILRGQDQQDAFLPTSVFLATDKSLEFDEASNTIVIDTNSLQPFSVVDGQHRLEGLKIAAGRDSRVLEFAVPVNIAVNLPKLHQMCHFLIVNTTQKSVDKAVAQRIVARLTEALDVEDLPSIPKWILRLVEKGELNKALKLVEYLNERNDSPWKGRVIMANDPNPSGDGTIRQHSFVTAIVKYVLTANNPISALNDFDKEKRIFLNYWKTIAEILGDDTSVLYKYNGIQLFCRFSIPFFHRLLNEGNFTVETMKMLLNDCFQNIESDYAGIGHPDWWASGSTASGLNSAAISQVAQAMNRALHKTSMSSNIEI